MKCSKCHAELDPNDKFCGECGQAVSLSTGHSSESNEPDSSNIAFVKISELYEYTETRPVRPLFWGYILSAHLNLKLARENVIEIIYPAGYFEYIHINYEDNIATEMSMFYSNMRISADELPQSLLLDSGCANLITYQYPDRENQTAPEDLITGYLNGDIRDCLILSCIPFSIELENQSTG